MHVHAVRRVHEVTPVSLHRVDYSKWLVRLVPWWSFQNIIWRDNEVETPLHTDASQSLIPMV